MNCQVIQLPHLLCHPGPIMYLFSTCLRLMMIRKNIVFHVRFTSNTSTFYLQHFMKVSGHIHCICDRSIDFACFHDFSIGCWIFPMLLLFSILHITCTSRYDFVDNLAFLNRNRSRMYDWYLCSEYISSLPSMITIFRCT